MAMRNVRLLRIVGGSPPNKVVNEVTVWDQSRLKAGIVASALRLKPPQGDKQP